MKSLFVLIFLSAVAFTSFSKDFGAQQTLASSQKDGPIKTYFAIAESSGAMCEMSFKLSRLLANREETDQEKLELADFQKCIAEYLPAVTSAHSKAQASLKKSAQRATLKEHFILLTNHLKGITPLDGEIVIDYNRRQNAERSSISLARTRFESEQ